MGISPSAGHRLLGISIADQTLGGLYENALSRQERTSARMVHSRQAGNFWRHYPAVSFPADLAGLRARSVYFVGCPEGRVACHSARNGRERLCARRAKSFGGNSATANAQSGTGITNCPSGSGVEYSNRTGDIGGVALCGFWGCRARTQALG